MITPVARRHFDENGKLKFTHGEYPAAMKTLAAQRGVRLIDMEEATMSLVKSLGDGPSKALYCHLPVGTPNYPDGNQDDTHLHQNGAIRYARLFLERLGI